MKKILSFLCGLTFSAIAMAQVSATGNPVIKESSPQVNGSNSPHSAQNGGPSLSETSKTAPENLILSETEFDFGKIPQGKPVIHVFEFKNTGSSRSEEHTSELQSPMYLVCRLLLEKKKH